VRLARGDRLAQARFSRGAARLSAAEVRALHAASPVCWLVEDGVERPLTQAELAVDADGWISLTVSLGGREPVGWRALPAALRDAHGERRVIEFAAEGAHDPRDFFEPLAAPDGRLVLEPGRFHVFTSRERLAIPPEHAAEMQPIDVAIGELRNNYAGFFDNGFGWRGDAAPDAPPDSPGDAPGAGRGGTPAVLEVRAHDVPFLVEDGQTFFRLALFATGGRPERLYGRGRTSYRAQDLTLARCFRAP
jgi:dCTP deaminase